MSSPRTGKLKGKRKRDGKRTDGRSLRSLLRYLPSVLFQYRNHLDGSHSFPYVSPGIEPLLQLSPTEVTNNARSVLSRIHPGDVRTVIASMRDAREKLGTWQLQFRMTAKDGSDFWIEVAATPEKVQDGSLRWNGFAREANETKMLEEDLRAAQEDLIRLSEERTQRLVEANERLSALNEEIKVEIKERIKLEKNLKESYELLSSLAGNLVRSEERERRRIASELHDNVVQHLALGKLRLELGLNKGLPFTELLHEQSHLMLEAMQQIREICNDLSPPVLYDFGLAKALKSLGTNLAQKTMPHLDLQYELEDLNLPDYAQAFLYQTARELVINAIKHAKASQLRVTLRKTPTAIRLTVEDDGVGFALGSKPGFGLANIQQRTLFHKGKLLLTSSPDMNTVVAVEIPAPSYREGPTC